MISELVRAGFPDTLHVNTIQIVGLFLLLAGTPEQKTWCERMIATMSLSSGAIVTSGLPSLRLAVIVGGAEALIVAEETLFCSTCWMKSE